MGATAEVGTLCRVRVHVCVCMCVSLSNWFPVVFIYITVYISFNVRGDRRMKES